MSLGAGPITKDKGIKGKNNFESLIRVISKLLALMELIDIKY